VVFAVPFAASQNLVKISHVFPFIQDIPKPCGYVPGPCISIDTACSSSLVSSNLLFNYLRKQPDPSITEAVSAAMINALNPGTFATWPWMMSDGPGVFLGGLKLTMINPHKPYITTISGIGIGHSNIGKMMTNHGTVEGVPHVQTKPYKTRQMLCCMGVGTCLKYWFD
jgi:hypothetical protein